MANKQNLPDKYSLKNHEKSEDMIFCYDTQGWPQYKQTIRDFLIGFGLIYNKRCNKWEIKDDDPRLDCIVTDLCDDGMGYGINEKYISTVSCFQSGDKYHCNIFREAEEKNVNLWKRTKFYPGAWVKLKTIAGTNIKNDNNRFMLENIQEEDGMIEFIAENYIEKGNHKVTPTMCYVTLDENEIEFI